MVITDALDYLSPYQYLRPELSGSCWNPTVAGYALEGVGNLDYSALRWKTFDGAVAALTAMGFVLSCGTRSTDPRTQSWTFVHVETATALQDAKEADARAWRAATPCFVRYGNLPRGGRSRNYADDTLEVGVSVYRGEQLPDGRARARPQTNQEFVGRHFLTDRPLYVVSGDEIGTGSDGEPVLAHCRIVRAVTR
jgi:hypothetical protein